MINKRMFRKIGGKKVMRKVGKHWKSVSLALLLAVGGGALAGQQNHAHASTVPGATPTTQNLNQNQQGQQNQQKAGTNVDNVHVNAQTNNDLEQANNEERQILNFMSHSNNIHASTPTATQATHTNQNQNQNQNNDLKNVPNATNLEQHGVQFKSAPNLQKVTPQSATQSVAPRSAVQSSATASKAPTQTQSSATTQSANTQINNATQNVSATPQSVGNNNTQSASSAPQSIDDTDNTQDVSSAPQSTDDTDDNDTQDVSLAPQSTDDDTDDTQDVSSAPQSLSTNIGGFTQSQSQSQQDQQNSSEDNPYWEAMSKDHDEIQDLNQQNQSVTGHQNYLNNTKIDQDMQDFSNNQNALISKLQSQYPNADQNSAETNELVAALEADPSEQPNAQGAKSAEDDVTAQDTGDGGFFIGSKKDLEDIKNESKAASAKKGKTTKKSKKRGRKGTMKLSGTKRGKKSVLGSIRKGYKKATKKANLKAQKKSVDAFVNKLNKEYGSPTAKKSKKSKKSKKTNFKNKLTNSMNTINTAAHKKHHKSVSYHSYSAPKHHKSASHHSYSTPKRHHRSHRR